MSFSTEDMADLERRKRTNKHLQAIPSDSCVNVILLDTRLVLSDWLCFGKRENKDIDEDESLREMLTARGAFFFSLH